MSAAISGWDRRRPTPARAPRAFLPPCLSTLGVMRPIPAMRASAVKITQLRVCLTGFGWIRVDCIEGRCDAMTGAKLAGALFEGSAGIFCQDVIACIRPCSRSERTPGSCASAKRFSRQVVSRLQIARRWMPKTHAGESGVGHWMLDRLETTARWLPMWPMPSREPMEDPDFHPPVDRCCNLTLLFWRWRG